MIQASSPAKAILFGEHAVVYGEPALAVALNRRITVRFRPSEESKVDGGRLSLRRHRYVRWALNNLWEGNPMDIRIKSSIPGASGLGSSAALSCSVAGALSFMKTGESSQKDIAKNAFDIEYNVQGGASPTDTSCSTHGGGILVNFEKGEDHLWSLSRNERTWHIHDLKVPEMTLVVGFTGRPSVTHIQVAKVRSFYERSGFARETVKEIGELTLDAVPALRRNDIEAVGRYMNRNHSLLSILGVSSKELQNLVDASAPLSYGAKLTGAGGGGSMIALTDRPDEVAEVIRSRGGKSFIVSISISGTEILKPDQV
jgi:mevalonate kinase